MIKNIIVTKLDDDSRIDRWLKRKFLSLSQSFIEKNLRKGIIKVNHKKIKANYIVIEGDIINIYKYIEKNYVSRFKIVISKKLPNKILREFNQSILFENSDFFIINKWSGISTQGRSKIGISINDIIKNLSEKYNLVHRLDKETSGLLIIAKILKQLKILVIFLKSKKFKKFIFALSQGIPKNLNSIVRLELKDKKILIIKFKLLLSIMSLEKNKQKLV